MCVCVEEVCVCAGRGVGGRCVGVCKCVCMEEVCVCWERCGS